MIIALRTRQGGVKVRRSRREGSRTSRQEAGKSGIVRQRTLDYQEGLKDTLLTRSLRLAGYNNHQKYSKILIVKVSVLPYTPLLRYFTQVDLLALPPFPR